MLTYQPPQVTLYREEHPEKQIAIAPQGILLPKTVTLLDYSSRSITTP